MQYCMRIAYWSTLTLSIDASMLQHIKAICFRAQVKPWMKYWKYFHSKHACKWQTDLFQTRDHVLVVIISHLPMTNFDIALFYEWWNGHLFMYGFNVMKEHSLEHETCYAMARPHQCNLVTVRTHLVHSCQCVSPSRYLQHSPATSSSCHQFGHCITTHLTAISVCMSSRRLHSIDWHVR